jgi:major vault protein
MVLKNPARDSSHPGPGLSNSLAELSVGQKVNISGPVSFALWPGQMVRVIEGHRLRRDQYLRIRIYDAEQATSSWHAALGDADGSTEPRAFVAGERFVIRGTDVSYYIPPTGVEVIPDEEGCYVRDAVVLGRLEYCILVGDDGSEVYHRGEAVVFPGADQRFVERDGRRIFPAIELTETTGVYVKVTAPYVDADGTEHHEGEELFISGREGARIYFPRTEHALIRVGGQVLHQAVAIPRGEGRYLLDRQSGEVALRRGPQMLLPDPRREVITRRVLGAQELALYYPGNDEAQRYNEALRRSCASRPTQPVAELLADDTDTVPDKPALSNDSGRGGQLERATELQGLRTITLDTKYEGAVTIDVWSGYAVQVVDRTGARRVVVGPATLLLEYDERLQPLTLSTGTPKSDEQLVSTVYLQVSGNKVSDRIALVSHDLVSATLTLTYRVSFEEPADAWFAVENYVKLICDHASSILKGRARQTPIRELVADVTEIVRDTLLGEKTEQGQQRPGLAFAECGARVFDVEVLDLTVDDTEVRELLDEAQLSAINHVVALSDREAELASRQRIEQIERLLDGAAHETALLRIRRQLEQAELQHDRAQQQQTHNAELAKARRLQQIADTEQEGQLQKLKLEMTRADQQLELAHRQAQQQLALAALQARVQGAVQQAEAFSPQLVAALNRLGDEQLLAGLSENFGELAAVEGRGLLETARKFLDFIPASMVPTLKAADGEKDT